MTENPYIDLIAQGIRERGMVRTGFSGRSMKPTFSDGMLLTIEGSDPRKVKVADIILYKRGAQMVVHRVVRISRKDNKSIFLTKGDNQAYMECDHVPEENYFGVVKGAFFKDDPQANVLIGNRSIGLAYALLGSSVISAMKFRKYVPQKMRSVLKYFAGGVFFVLKKSIHTLYIGMRYGQLLFRRRGNLSAGA